MEKSTMVDKLKNKSKNISNIKTEEGVSWINPKKY